MRNSPRTPIGPRPARLVAVVATVGLSLAGCTSLEGSGPMFSSTIAWDNRFTDEDSPHSTDGGAATMSLRIEPGGTGYVVGFPRGRSVLRDKGAPRKSVCLDTEGTTTYTGPISWAPDGHNRFALTFEGSKISVASAARIAGHPEWSTLGILRCGDTEPGSWELSLACADVTMYDPRLLVLATCGRSTPRPTATSMPLALLGP